MRSTQELRNLFGQTGGDALHQLREIRLMLAQILSIMTEDKKGKGGGNRVANIAPTPALIKHIEATAEQRAPKISSTYQASELKMVNSKKNAIPPIIIADRSFPRPLPETPYLQLNVNQKLEEKTRRDELLRTIPEQKEKDHQVGQTLFKAQNSPIQAKEEKSELSSQQSIIDWLKKSKKDSRVRFTYKTRNERNK